MTQRGARFQTAVDRAKALKQYETLRRAGMVKKAVVIAELKSGDFHILGQNCTPEEIAPLLVVGADALQHADANRRLVKLVAHQEPERRGVHNQAKPRPRTIKTAPDGTLIPPPGENFVSCGECSHPTWFVLHHNDSDRTSRYACAHCGNEVAEIMVTHPGGTA